jgi:predicted transcriptional regulator
MPSHETRVMTAHVPLPLADEVHQLAAKLERSRGWVLKQALAAHVEREAERHRMTVEALGDVAAQNGVSHDDVKAWAASLPLTPTESSASPAG